MHSWCLAALDRPLVSEYVKAWVYGPVVPIIYHAFSKYGKSPITELIQCNTQLTDKESIRDRKQVLQSQFDEDEIKIMDAILQSHQNYSASELIEITHEKDGPWEKTYKKGEVPQTIPYDLIKEHYKRIIKNGTTN